MEKEKKDRIFLFVFRFISLIIIIFCLFLLYNWNLENKANAAIADSLVADSTTEEVISISSLNADSQTENSNTINENPIDKLNVKIAKPNFDELIAKNDKTVGWIMINNTNINYPIVQSNNNSYYLKHNFNKESNSAGWIFADYKNSFGTLDDNTIIYGHNRRNNTMFSSLRQYLEPSFYTNEENKYFSFSTKNDSYIGEVFSVYKANSNSLEFTNLFSSTKDFENFLKDSIARSINNFNTEVTTSDKIITLCTCDNNNLFRIVVHAKLIPINSSVKEN